MGATVVIAFPPIDTSKEHHHIPLSALAVAAPLERLGVSYEIFDQRVQDIERFDELVKDASILAVSLYTGYQTHKGYELLRRAKRLKPNITTVVGGPHVTALPEQTSSDELVDYAIAGFGEEPFSLLLMELLERDGVVTTAIPGLHSRHIRANGDAGDPGNLFSVPSPGKFDNAYWEPLPYHKIDIESYIHPENKRVMYVAHYGCPARCTFCATPHFRKWTPKPIEFVNRDIEKLFDIFDWKQVCFFDATLFTRKDRVHAVIDCLDPYEGVEWIADARAVELAKYSTEELCEIRDKKGNLQSLIVGLESGSPRIVELMKKGKKHLDMFMDVMRKLHDADIIVTSGLIFGIPTETTEDLQLTIEYVREVRRVHPAFRLSSTFFRPLPGTELFDLLNGQGKIKPRSLQEWAEHGGANHFEYNVWMDIPWMDRGMKGDYRRMYDRFIQEHGEILV